MRHIKNYKSWEQGYYEHAGSYRKSDGTLIFCYKYYFCGKAEIIETRYPLDVSKLNKELEQKYA